MAVEKHKADAFMEEYNADRGGGSCSRNIGVLIACRTGDWQKSWKTPKAICVENEALMHAHGDEPYTTNGYGGDEFVESWA